MTNTFAIACLRAFFLLLEEPSSWFSFLSSLFLLFLFSLYFFSIITLCSFLSGVSYSCDSLSILFRFLFHHFFYSPIVFFSRFLDFSRFFFLLLWAFFCAYEHVVVDRASTASTAQHSANSSAQSNKTRASRSECDNASKQTE